MAYVLDKIGYRLLRVGISYRDWYDERIRPIVDATTKVRKVRKQHDWNNSYVDVLADLRVAKKERNRAIMNLFFITRKFAQLREYMRLARYEEAKAAEVYSQYGNVLPESQEEWDRARKLVEAARAKLFGNGGK